MRGTWDIAQSPWNYQSQIPQNTKKIVFEAAEIQNIWSPFLLFFSIARNPGHPSAQSLWKQKIFPKAWKNFPFVPYHPNDAWPVAHKMRVFLRHGPAGYQLLQLDET
jgi:hypothetical protein